MVAAGVTVRWPIVHGNCWGGQNLPRGPARALLGRAMTDGAADDSRRRGLRAKLHAIVFEAETPAGRTFDIALLVLIVASVVAICVETVDDYREAWGPLLTRLEWGFTAIFTVEYLVRLYCVRRPLAYATSFYGIIDLVAVLPAYAALVFAGGHQLGTVRVIRLVRVFRVLKLVQFLGEARTLRLALRKSTPKIVVFLLSIFCTVVVIGTLMYVIEGSESGFDSIPRSIYWAIVTLTTVGYGDISPQSGIGQAVASGVMLMGYAVIAVPTGIVSSELVRSQRDATSTRSCPSCSTEDHRDAAVHCYHCGAKL